VPYYRAVIFNFIVANMGAGKPHISSPGFNSFIFIAGDITAKHFPCIAFFHFNPDLII
jgi:hypothetical protein